MILAVADTHAAIWYLADDSRLSLKAGQVIDQAADNGDQIAISSISFIEMVYLIEKGRIAPEQFSQLANQVEEPNGLFTEISVSLKLARALSRVNSSQIPDMPDRIVAATAIHLGVPVISRDGEIRVSGINTIW
jgi:PIN domain nuclease of toxin-antitoxin system